MRLEFEPNASTLPQVETEASTQNVSSDLEKLLRDGVKAAQEGKRAEARTMLLRVTEGDADNENAWLWLASISEYPEELLVFLNNVLRVNPENERALEWHRATRSLLAKTLVQRGIDALRDERADFARQCFEQAIEHEAESELAWLWLASSADNDEEKASCFEKVLEINPENETAKSSLAEMNASKTQAVFNEALKAAFDGNHFFAYDAIATVLTRDASFVDAWVLKSHIAATFEERAESLLKIREIDPENEYARAALASWRELAEKQPRDVEVAAVAEEPAEELAAEDEVELETGIAPEEAVAETAPEPTPEEVEEAVAEVEESFNAEFSAYPETIEATDFAPFAAETEEVAEAAPEDLATEEVVAEVAVAEVEEEAVAEVAIAEELATEELVEELASEEVATEDEIVAEGEAAIEALAQEIDEIPEAEAADEPKYVTDEELASNDAPEALAAPEFAEENEVPEVSEVVEEGPAAQSEEAEQATVSFDTEETEVEAPSEQPALLEDDPIHLSFIQADDDPEAEDFFKNLTIAEPQPLAETQDFRDTSPQIFVNYEPVAPENSFVAEAVAPIVEAAPAELPEVDVFAPVEPAAVTVASNHETIEDFPTSRHEAALCPFCNAENDPKAFVCISCQSVLTLSDMEMLLSHRGLDTEKLRQAVASLEAENESYGLGAEQLMSLGIGHINLKNYRQGFHYLQESVRSNPNNVVLDAQVNALAIRLSEIEEQQHASEGHVKNCKILVVDDSPTVRKLISGKLEKSGHEVICAVDGVDALAKINEIVPDLILLDITMPRMDGYQVCKMIRGNEQTKDVPVVMISGKDGFFDKVRGKMAGTTGYITKPFGPETLMKTVETYLG